MENQTIQEHVWYISLNCTTGMIITAAASLTLYVRRSSRDVYFTE